MFKLKRFTTSWWKIARYKRSSLLAEIQQPNVLVSSLVMSLFHADWLVIINFCQLSRESWSAASLWLLCRRRGASPAPTRGTRDLGLEGGRERGYRLLVVKSLEFNVPNREMLRRLAMKCYKNRVWLKELAHNANEHFVPWFIAIRRTKFVQPRGEMTNGRHNNCQFIPAKN